MRRSGVGTNLLAGRWGMDRLRGLAICAVAASLLLAGCKATSTATAEKPAADGQALGRDLVGEECRGVPGHDDLSDPNAPPRLDLFCGKEKGIAGVVHASLLPLALPPSGVARREAVERAAAQTFGGAGIASRLDCQKGHWLTADNGNESMIALCYTRAGNWPQIVATVPV